MNGLRTASIAAALGSLAEVRLGRDRPLSGAGYDSRTIEQGQLFVALPGERHDGHDFILDAVEHGAVAVICARVPAGLPEDVTVARAENPLLALQELAAWWRRQCPVRVIGITGSVGKTTVKEVLAHLLGQRHRVLRNPANANNELGLPVTLLSLTPEDEVAVLEMGMYTEGEIARLCEIAAPEAAIVTNVGPIHLERIGSIEGIERAKGELPAALPASGFAVLNLDDPRVARMPTPARRITYGTTEGATYRALDVTSHGLAGVSFAARTPRGCFRVRMPLPGAHLVESALAALAAALEFGLSSEEASARLATLPDTGRMRILPGRNGSTILDDTYNAGPASMVGALRLLAELPGRRIAVLGQMNELGAASEAGHREVGEWAARCCDLLFTTGGQASIIASSAAEHGLTQVHAAESKEEVQGALAPVLRQSDFVLLKASRGVELETILDGIRG